MVKLTRVERACEQTGNPACPLVRSQQAETLRPKGLRYSHMQAVVHAVQPSWHAGIAMIDPRWKPAKRILFVRRKP